MRVQGTEQVIMGKVLDSTSPRDIKDTKRSGIDMGKRPQRESGEEKGQERTQISADEAVERINKALDALNIRMKFEVHTESGEDFGRIFNEETNEVIRDIPSEKTLDLLAHVRRMVGVLVDERV